MFGKAQHIPQLETLREQAFKLRHDSQASADDRSHADAELAKHVQMMGLEIANLEEQ